MATPITVTVGSGQTYADLAAFVAWVATQDLVTLDQIVTAEVHNAQTLPEWSEWSMVDAAYTDLTRYVIIRPAAGLSFAEVAGPITAMPATGLTINLSSTGGYGLRIGRGFVIEDFRIVGTNSGTRGLIETQVSAGTSVQGGLRRCALSTTSTTGEAIAIDSGGGGLGATVQDCYIVGPGSTTVAVVYVRDFQLLERCTIVSLDETKNALRVEVEYSLTPLIKNNALHGGVDFIYLSNAHADAIAVTDKNFYTGSLTKTGAFTEYSAGSFASVTAAAAFESATTNFTPKAGGPLVGAAEASANSTIDVNGESRGSAPDVGAIELVASDTTAPTLSSGVGAATGTTTASGSVTTDEAGGTLYRVTTVNASESASTVKSGASQAVVASGVQNMGATGLTHSTTYRHHYLHRDAAGNDSTVLSTATFTTDTADTTAPTLTSPVGAATGTTTASGGVTTDEANGTLYAVTTTSATPPTAAQVRAGQDHTGAAAAFAANQAITTTGAKTIAATGLTSGTAYYHHFHHRDASNNDSTVSTSAQFTTTASDTTAPTLSSGTGVVESNALIVVGATTDEANGTMYVVLTTSATPPSATQVRNGQNHAGAAASFAANQAISSTGAKSFNATGLAQLTGYYPYIVHRDAANNDSAVMSIGLRTTFRDGATGQYILDNTGPIGGAEAGILFNDVDSGDEDKWFSFEITTPPASGTLDINPDGTFTFDGLVSTFFEYQLEVDGVDVGSPVTVGLYANTQPATPANSMSGATVSSTTAIQTHQATPAGASSGATVQSTTAIQVQLATPADSVSGATVQSTTATQSGTHSAVPADCVGGATVESTSAMQPATATPADSLAGATVTSSRAIALSRERAAASAQYPLVGAFREKFEKQPGEMLDYDINFGRYLAYVGDTAAEVGAVEGIAEDGLTLVAAHWVPELNSMKVWFNGGENRAKRYRATFWLNTQGGRRVEADLQIRVKDY